MNEKLNHILAEDIPQVADHYNFECKSTMYKLELTTPLNATPDNTLELVVAEAMSGTPRLLDEVTQLTEINGDGNRLSRLYFVRSNGDKTSP